MTEQLTEALERVESLQTEVSVTRAQGDASSREAQKQLEASWEQRLKQQHEEHASEATELHERHAVKLQQQQDVHDAQLQSLRSQLTKVCYFATVAQMTLAGCLQSHFQQVGLSQFPKHFGQCPASGAWDSASMPAVLDVFPGIGV